MTLYRIELDKRFLKDLEKVPKLLQKGISERVNNLAHNPRPDGYTKLSGSRKIPLYRIRCGNYRVVYIIKDDVLLVVVLEMGHRRDIYRDL